MAELQWITGGVPKTTTDKTAGTVVQDAPNPEVRPTPTGNQDIVISHLITCSKIVNNYPSDSVNYFFLDKNTQVCYYAYFMTKPSSRIHTATVEWFNPANTRIVKYEQEFKVAFTDRCLTIQNDTYQWFLLTMTVGMDHMNAEYGQTGLPRDVGLYTIHLTIDGQLVGITFFYVKPQETKAPSPISTVPPATKGNLLPMATPFSNLPIPSGITQ
jgi:hypothetical protein